MTFKSEKQRKWMHANEPEMAKKWEKEDESVNEANASVIRKKLLKQFGDDPLYKDFIIAKTPKDQKKALKTLKSIRGFNAVRLMQKYVKKLQGESIKGKLRNVIRQEIKSINESDLGLTYKKGKTVKVTHNKSGKEIVIIDKPNVRKEYEKIGFFAEGSCGYGIGGKVGDEPAGPHLLKRKKKDMKEAKTVSIDGEELLNFLMKRFKYSKKQAIATMKKHKMDTSFLKKESVNEWKMNTNLKKDKNDSPQIKKVKKVAKKVGKKLGAKGYEESVNEGDKKKYWDLYTKWYKTYEAFARETMNLAKSATKVGTTGSSDERIILKNFKKQVIPFVGLMSSWSKGHEKNPHIDEKIKVKIQNQTKSISEDIVRGNEVHAKTKKELKAAIARSMKEILNGKTPKYDIINGMSGEMIGWKDGNDYIWQPNAIPYAERELK